MGERKITKDVLKRDIQYVTSGMGVGEEGVKQITDPLVSKMVDHYLIMEYGKQKDIALSENELGIAVRDIQGDYSGKVFQEMLLHRYVDFEEWKEILKQQLFIKKVIKSASESITPISFHEIKTYFDSHREEFMRSQRVKFRQVVTRTKEEAEKILGRLTKGENLGELAREYSISPEADRGGEVGWIARGELEESMEKAIFSLPIGKISPVVKTPYGYHIFEVQSKRPEGSKTLPEARKEIESKLFHQKEVLFYERWLKELREVFPVKINVELLKTLEFG